MDSNEPWILSYTGKKINFTSPNVNDIDIVDIAHSLSMLCRFGGHTNRFYSVAEHSVHVSKLVPKSRRLEALLHDAAEAYLVDIPTPIKNYMPNYKRMEDHLLRVIYQKFGISTSGDYGPIHYADRQMLLAEKEVLLYDPNKLWAPFDVNSVEIPKVDFYFATPSKAESIFLDTFDYLTP